MCVTLIKHLDRRYLPSKTFAKCKENWLNIWMCINQSIFVTWFSSHKQHTTENSKPATVPPSRKKKINKTSTLLNGQWTCTEDHAWFLVKAPSLMFLAMVLPSLEWMVINFSKQAALRSQLRSNQWSVVWPHLTFILLKHVCSFMMNAKQTDKSLIGTMTSPIRETCLSKSQWNS